MSKSHSNSYKIAVLMPCVVLSTAVIEQNDMKIGHTFQIYIRQL